MALINLMDMASRLAPGARLLGLDPGAKRIGVALSDVKRQIASPYATLARDRLKVNAAALGAIITAEGVGGLVVGLPLDDDQKLGPKAQAARDWAYALSESLGLPACLVDESFTTADAHERMITAGLSRARRGEIIDKMAAAAILQSALDMLQIQVP
ncbi:MAG: Holliday junction resolvase RuvX [Acidocella sp.]|nr:Holliday junction resolvase RuvX [Acidocella sp.]